MYIKIPVLVLVLLYMLNLNIAESLQLDKVFHGIEESEKNALLDVIRRVGDIETTNNLIKEENKRLRVDVTALFAQISLMKMDHKAHIAKLQSMIGSLRAKNRQQENKIKKLLSLRQDGLNIIQDDAYFSQNADKEITGQDVDFENSVKFETMGLSDNKGHVQSDEILDESISDHVSPGLEFKKYADLTIPFHEETPISLDMKTVEKEEQVQKIANENRRELSVSTSEQHHRVQRENEVNVAFYATIGQHHIEHAGTNQTIVFDDVITNLGNAYSEFAGDFRAPVAGTYVFSVTLMAYASQSTHCRFVKNGITVGNIYLGGVEGAYATSAMTTVLNLQQGDDVSIQNIDPDKNVHGYAYSVFSGFLLQQHFQNPAVVGK